MLTAVSIEQEYDARAVFHALVRHLFLYATTEEALAALARRHAVVVARRSVAAYFAQAY